MARILLVKCNEYVYPYGITHPLGLMYISAYLRRAGHEVKLLDTRLGGRMDARRVADEARAFRPDVAGLSALIVEAKHMHEVSQALKSNFPKLPIVAGGPYISSCPERALSDKNIDFGVIGEGEETFGELAAALISNGGADGIPGTVCIQKNGALDFAPERPFIADIDAMPFPDWESADMRAYDKERRFSNRAPGRYAPVFTSRACPYNCIYCHNIFGKNFRARSPENVFAEIKELHQKYLIHEIEVIDDTFNLDRARAMRILDMLAASGMKLRLAFPNAVRGDLVDDEFAAAMKRAGAEFVAIAIESASPRIQKLIRKNLNIEKARLAIESLARAGIFCHGYFMIGFPTETEEEIRATVEFARGSMLHSGAFFIVTPAPGTELFEMCAERLDKIPDYNSYSYHAVALNCSEVPDKTLEKIYHRAFLRFYMKPSRIIRIIMGVRNKAFLFKSMLHLLHRIIFSEKAVPSMR